MQRHEFLNHLIDLKGECKRYLEIGCDRDKTFSRVNAEKKVGVDPRRGGTHRMTSDEFFASCDPASKWNLIFVDGYHHAGQVMSDVQNALGHLAPGGVIVLDDCLPREEYQQRIFDDDENLITGPPDGRPWTGDVWKAVVKLRQRSDLDVCTVNEGWGFGVVIPRRNTFALHAVPPELITWENYGMLRQMCLRTIPLAELPAFLNHSPNSRTCA